MDKKKLGKQLAVIALLIVLFAGLDLAIYQLFIKRVISHHTPGMQKMSVEVANYVPFTGSGNVYSAYKTTSWRPGFVREMTGRFTAGRCPGK